MQPHPDFADVALPRDFRLGSFHLTPLSPAQTEEDYGAVMAAAPVITGVFGGDWPQGLTLEDNRVDMGWHDREFTARRSFAWILRDEADDYIGCFYIYPDIGARGRATAVFWLCDVPDRLQVATELKALLEAWMAESLPSGIALTWQTSPAL